MAADKEAPKEAAKKAPKEGGKEGGKMHEMKAPERPPIIKPSFAWEGPPALVVIGGQGLTIGSRLNLQPGRTVLGRDPQADIPIQDGSMSRRHVELSRTETGEVVAADLGSRHGSFVNDVRIDSVQALQDGDYLRCGNVVLRFRTTKVGAEKPAEKKAGKAGKAGKAAKADEGAEKAEGAEAAADAPAKADAPATADAPAKAEAEAKPDAPAKAPAKSNPGAKAERPAKSNPGTNMKAIAKPDDTAKSPRATSGGKAVQPASRPSEDPTIPE